MKLSDDTVINELAQLDDVQALAQTGADTEFIGMIIKSLIKAAAAPLLGNKIWAVGCGGKAKDEKFTASHDDPCVTYISSHKTKPTVEHKTM